MPGTSLVSGGPAPTAAFTVVVVAGYTLARALPVLA
jgi:hypothetical protein